MLNIRDLKIDAEATTGKPLLLIKEAPTFAFENGVATQRVDGTRYTVACPGCGMESLAVKVPGPQTLSRGERAIVPVQFEGLELYIYFRDSKPMVGARATAIKPVEDKR